MLPRIEQAKATNINLVVFIVLKANETKTKGFVELNERLAGIIYVIHNKKCFRGY